jgi:hypothetical protein
MAEKNLSNIRIINKHDTEANWLKATGFIPKQGELIVYDKDSTYSYERFKIGDGSTVVSSLPFADANKVDKVAGKGLSTNDYTTTEKNKLAGIAEGANKTVVDSALSASSTNPVQNKVVNTEIGNLKSLVGDIKVSEQIAAANMIYVGPNMPTDSNIKVWINTAEEGTGVVPVLPRISTITLNMNNWTGAAAPYSQVVDINTVTTATKVELNPTVSQIISLQNDDIALMADNDGGVVTIYSFGGKPSTNMTMQVTLTEVSYV